MIDKFAILNNNLSKNDFIDSSNSGSTGIVIIASRCRFACSSIGDSRAFLYSISDDSITDFCELTKLHLPEDPLEKKRIEMAGGEIRKNPDPKDKSESASAPLRVFKGKDRVPGLMMTRSFGDIIGHSCGISSIPGNIC